MRIKKISVRKVAAMLAAAMLLSQIPGLPVQASEVIPEEETVAGELTAAPEETVAGELTAPEESAADDLMGPEDPDEPDEPEERLIPVRVKSPGMEITIQDSNDPEIYEAVTEVNADKYSAAPYSCNIGDWIIHAADPVSLEITVKPSDDDKVAVVIANYGEGKDSEEVIPLSASGSRKEFSISINDEESFDIVEKEYKSVRFVTYHAEIFPYGEAEPFSGNTAKVVEDRQLKFTITADEDYHIESVKAGDAYIEEDQDDIGVYTVPRVTDDMTVIVTCVPDDRKISFDMKLSDPVDVDVFTDGETIYQDPDDTEKYLLTYKGEGIRFAFTPADGEVPAVYYVGHNLTVHAVEADAVLPEGKFEYYIPWENIPAKTTIVIQNSQASRMQTVSMEYPSAGDPIKNISVRCDGSEVNVSEVSDQDGVHKVLYEVEFGKTVSIQTDMSDEYDVGTAELAVSGEKSTSNMLCYAVYRRNLPVTGDISVKINPVERYALRIKDSKDSKGKYHIPSFTGIRHVSERLTLEPGDYTVELFKGKNKIAFPDDESDETVRFSPNNVIGSFTDDNSGYKFSVSDNLRRKHIDMSLKIMNPKTGKYSVNDRLTVEFVPDLYSLEVKRAPSKPIGTDSRDYFFVYVNKGDITSALRNVPADTTRIDYRVTYGKEGEDGADVGKDSVYASMDFRTKTGASAVRFCITTKYEETEDGVLTVHFFDKKNPDKDLLTVPMTIVKERLIQETEPKASVSKATDVSASIELPYIPILKPRNGKTYYRLKVTPEDAAEGETAPADLIEKTYYVERTYPVYLDYPDNATEADIEKIDSLNDKRAKEYKQYVTVPLINRSTGQGFRWNFNMEVSCVNVKGGSTLSFDQEADAAEKIYNRTNDDKVQKLGISTLEPVYALSVSAKKLKDTLYAGETDVAAAVISYGKGTTCAGVTAADVTGCKEEEKLDVRVDDAADILIISSDSSTMTGKHTISITPAGAEQGIYQKPVTMTVTVDKPVDEITVRPEAFQYLKQKDKALTVKFSADFNQTSGEKPKNAKAVYYITDQYGNVIDEESPLYGLVKISNGSITIDRSFEIPEDMVSTVFRIKAVADDFTENMTSGLSGNIKIKRDPTKIGALMLLSYDNGSRIYRTAAKDGDTVTTEDINGAIVAALKENAPVKDTYYKYELSEYLIDADQLKFTTSNKNALPLQTDGTRVYAGANRTANNVTLTANTTDGGKENAKIKVNIVYAEPKELGLKISSGEKSAENQPFAFAGTHNTVVSVTVIKRDSEGGEWSELDSAVDYKLSISGGSFITKDEASGRYTMNVMGEKAELKLTYKKAKSQYVVTNSAFNVYKSNSVSLKQKGTLLSDTGNHQEVDLVFGSSYNLSGKSVLVSVDSLQAAKKPDMYGKLCDACPVLKNGSPIALTPKDGKQTVTLRLEGAVPASGYKLSVAAGRIEEGEFIPETKPASFTLSVTKPKTVRGSFNPASTLKISKKNPAPAVLSDTGKELKSLAYTKIYNCNVKGVPNHFTDYFEFVPTAEGVKAEVRLKDGLSAEQKEYIMSSKGSADRTAFLEYNAAYGDDGYGNPLTETTAVVKISVSFVN